MQARLPLSRVNAPGVLYTALTIGLVVALASLTLTARQVPPPTVAEVAPDAGEASPSGAQALAGDEATDTDTADQAPLTDPTRPVGPDPGPLPARPAGGGTSAEGGVRHGVSGGGGPGVGDGASGMTPPPPPTTTTTTPPPTTTTTPSNPDPGPDPNTGPPRSGSQRCIGIGPNNDQPPFRQTEDPRSPPCVTSDTVATPADSQGVRGVDDKYVNVAVFVPSGGSMNTTSRPIYEKLEDFFNNRYEFYGRRLNFVYPNTNQSGFDAGSANANETGQIEQANAVADYEEEFVDEETGTKTKLGVFASTNNGQTPSPHYDNQLAKRGVVLVSSQERIALTTEPQLRKFQWHYQPDFLTSGANLGKWLCAQFNPGAFAVHAGGAEALKLRKFGYVKTRYPDDSRADMDAVDAALKTCGLVPADATVQTLELDYKTGDPVALQNAMTGLNSMRQNNVTSIICACKSASVRTMMMPAASNLGFLPEWITTTWGQNDVDRYVATPPDQMAHAFGISNNLEWVPEGDLPIDWAVNEVDPAFTWPVGQLFQDAYTWEAWRYPALLMVAAGVQAAGPNLTPETFRAGLESLSFPNPARASDRYAARARTPRVGFGPGDHVMSKDAVVTWWSNSERSNWDGALGTWCYADGGARFTFNTWKRVSIFPLTGICRT